MKPSYEGLKKINSDETFCVSYKAGKDGVLGGGGNDYHDLKRWTDFGSAGSPFDTLQKVLEIPMSIPAMLRLEVKIPLAFTTLKFTIDPLGWLGMRVGFSGCGIGEEGAEIGGTDNAFKSAVLGGILSEVLNNTLSGRNYKITAGAAQIDVPPFRSGYVSLRDELNNKFKETCNPQSNEDEDHRRRTNRKGYWNTWLDPIHGIQLDTVPSSRDGVCLVPSTKVAKYNKPTANDVDPEKALWQMGSPDQENEKENNSVFFLKNYFQQTKSLVCFGTYLFEWEGFSGTKYIPSQAKGTAPTEIASPDSHPNVPKDDAKSYICPGFEANADRGRQPIWYPSKKLGQSNEDAPQIDLNRSAKTFVAPIRDRLVNLNNPIAQADGFKDLQGKVPTGKAAIRGDAMKKIDKYLQCIRDVSYCDYRDASGGYFKNQAVDDQGKRVGAEVIFRPSMATYNWLCPFGSDDLSADEVLRFLLKFKDLDGARWRGNYKTIQEWHNMRVDDFVTSMKCAEWEAFNKLPRKAPPKKSSSGSASTPNDSNDYCADDADYCWQKALEDKPGKSALQKGELSFFIPENPDGDSEPPKGATALEETPLEKSLHYAVFSMIPLRTDKVGSIVGRNDGSELAHCPANLDVEVKLENGNPVKVCDIRPVIGYISRKIQSSGSLVKRDESEKFGIDGQTSGDVNLAGGGSFRGLEGLMFGESGFMGISQARAKFQDNSPGAPPKPSAPKTRAKIYQMFWPSWYPAMEPSRVMSRILPGSMSPLVED